MSSNEKTRVEVNAILDEITRLRAEVGINSYQVEDFEARQIVERIEAKLSKGRAA